MKTYWQIYQGAYTAYRNLKREELIKIFDVLQKKEHEIIATKDLVRHLIQKKFHEEKEK